MTPKPDAAWVQQGGRNLTDCYDGFLLGTRYLLLDRDKKFLSLRHVLESTGTNVVLLPPKSPNLNAQIERFMHSLKSECLERMVFFGERSLRRALAEFVKHYLRQLRVPLDEKGLRIEPREDGLKRLILRQCGFPASQPHP